MKSKAVVLLSSGLDSSVNLFEAAKVYEIVMALTFDYGQKAAAREIESSQKLSKTLGINHKILDLKWFKDFNRSSLIVDSEKIPTGAQVQIDDMKTSEKTALSVWVPNRNGIFLNVAAAYAEALQAEYVIPGFNIEEAATFADNSEEYMKSLDHAFSFSTNNKVKVKCFTSHMNKTQIVQRGDDLYVPWHLIWPCYQAKDKWCGQCESCQRAKRAFHEAQIPAEALFSEDSF